MQGFRERAQAEAERYGSDAWVFVRELLQNARDAAATRVTFDVVEHGGRVCVTCRDDGCGMTFEHARRWLFRLYASSKEGQAGQAGRFGVGFWSVLLFRPARLRVRSWPAAGEPWEVEFDAELSSASGAPPAPAERGSEVRLERDAAPDDARAVSLQIEAAARRYARFLTRLGSLDQPLDVRVDGRPSAEAFDLEPPRATFRRRGLRGVVGLGRAPRVELWAKGLRVRVADSLTELATVERADDPRPPATPRPGLAPVVLLDSHDVELTLARDDARGNAALARLVRTAQRELDRLLAAQLECLRPRSVWRRAWDGLAGLRGVGLGAAATALALTVGALAARWLAAPATSRQEPPRAAASRPSAAFAVADADGMRSAAGRAPSEPRPGRFPARARLDPPPRPYTDLGASYAGPVSDVSASRDTLLLSYSPPELRPFLAALWLVDPDAPVPSARDVGPYDEHGPPTERGATSIALVARADGRPLRLPVPSGETIDPADVRVDGQAARLRLGAQGEALLVLPVGVHEVNYVTRRAPASRAERALRAATVLPDELFVEARRLRQTVQPGNARAEAAAAWIARRVRYSLEPQVAAAHARLRALPLAERALHVGAGDCDVQNGVLALLLQAAGLAARLAVGYVGEQGRARPGLHAWAEYVGDDGAWRVIDASALEAPLAPEDAPRATRPTSAPEADPERSPPPAGLAIGAWSTAALALVALLALGAARARRRLRREVRLDAGRDVSELLRGVLQNPAAFGGVTHLLRRPLLPALHGAPLSLDAARALAARGQLYVSRVLTPFAREASRDGAHVLDARRDEARVAAEALGAVDLDLWHARLRDSRQSPLLALLTARLANCGLGWRVVAGEGVGECAWLDLRLRRGRARRVVVLDADLPWLRAAEADHARWPHVARLALAERLARQLRLPPDEMLDLLGPLARAALDEAAP